MKKTTIILIASLAAVLFYAFSLKNEATNISETVKSGINWVSIDEAQKLSKKEPRQTFVDVYTSWCGWCKKMDKSTFENSDITEYVNKNYYAVKLDAESSRQITFNGKKMSESELAAAVFQVQGYPTIVLIEKDFSNYQTIPGYQNAENFQSLLEKFSARNKGRK